MTDRLDAKVCVAYVEDGVVFVGFSDDEFEPSVYLLLQRAVSLGLQDIALGHDTVHVTYCDQSRSSYGGVLQFILHQGKAQIQFAKETASKLGTTQHLDIHFVQNEKLIDQLIYHLQQIFAGQAGVFVPKVRG